MVNTVLLSGLFHGSIISHSMEQFAETTDPDVPTHGIFTYCNHHVSICHCGSEGQYHDITKKNHRLEKLERFPSLKAKSEVDCTRLDRSSFASRCERLRSICWTCRLFSIC